MQNPTDSALARIRALIELIIKTLDPDYPSVIIEPPPVLDDDGARYYGEGRRKPDFVEQDDAGWQRIN